MSRFSKNKVIVVIVLLIVVISGIIWQVYLHLINKPDLPVDIEISQTTEAVETTAQSITVATDDLLTNYPTEAWNLDVSNEDAFIESDGEQLYEDFTSDGRSIKYEDGVYVKDTLTQDADIISEVIDMLAKKNMPKPYRIDSTEQDSIYVIYNGRGYMFRSDGSQVMPEVEESHEITTAYETEEESTVAELEEPGVGLDAEDAFNNEYGDVSAWVQEQIDGVSSDELYVHPYEQTSDGEWLYRDSRDRSMYKIVYDAEGRMSSIERYSN